MANKMRNTAFDVVTHWRVRDTADAFERMFAKQEKIEAVVGRPADFSEFSLGEREVGWEAKSQSEARKIAAAIHSLKLCASIIKQEEQ